MGHRLNRASAKQGIGYRALVIDYWLLIIDYWLLVIGYWLLVIGGRASGYVFPGRA
jgi:hypothetical protein